MDSVHICDTDTEHPNGQQKNEKQANARTRNNENLILACDEQRLAKKKRYIKHLNSQNFKSCQETLLNQAPPSLGFSRQEHWSGLPFPFPMHGSEKWKWSRSVVSDP